MTLEESQELNKKLIACIHEWRRYARELKKEYLAELYQNVPRETFARIAKEIKEDFKRINTEWKKCCEDTKAKMRNIKNGDQI